MAGGRRILVGVVGAAQGVRGEVRIKSYTGEPLAIGRYGPLLAEDGRSLTLTALRALKDDMLVAAIAGIGDRDAARALTGTRLYVERDRLPPPEGDEVYQVDLIGLDAEDEDGRRLGRVASIENHGAGDILAIAPEGGGETLLVPFTREFVPVLDIPGGRLTVAAGALAADDEDARGAEDGEPG